MKLITLAIRGYRPHAPFSPVVHSSAKLVLALVSTLVLATSMVNAGTNARVLPIGSHAFGHTYGEWAAAWWQWALETPASMNPLTDTTGEFAGVNQSGPVWFLAGNLGGSSTRTVTIPAGTALFFPVVNTFWGYLPCELSGDDAADIAYSITTANEAIDTATGLAVEIDGVLLSDLRSYREQSPLFSFTLPTDNVYGVPADYCGNLGLEVTLTIDAGIYILLAPLPPGTHTIRVQGTLSSVPFTTDVTYTIIVE
jgi:hypothetical protein